MEGKRDTNTALYQRFDSFGASIYYVIYRQLKKGLKDWMGEDPDDTAKRIRILSS